MTGSERELIIKGESVARQKLRVGPGPFEVNLEKTLYAGQEEGRDLGCQAVASAVGCSVRESKQDLDDLLTFREHTDPWELS
jgi:hypothetical protein